MFKHNVDPSLATAFSPSEYLAIGSAALSAALAGVSAHLYKGKKTAETVARKAEERLKAAKIDTLTGLHRRDTLYETFDGIKNSSKKRAHDASMPESDNHSIIMVDLDGLTEANNRHGHKAGDQLLEATGEAIKQTMRKRDEIVRWGGDEFAGILPHTDVEGALVLGEKITQALRERGVTASIGVAKLEFGQSLDDNIARGDAAMYAVKQSGRDGVAQYQADMETPANPRSTTIDAA